MSLNIKRIQVTKNGTTQDVDILTSAECVSFEDGASLQDKYDSGDIASVNTIGDVSELNGDIVTSLNELNASSKANTELIEGLANRPSMAMALKKEVASGEWGSVSTLPYEFSSGSSVVYQGKIHLLGGGGYSGSGSIATYATKHYRYNGTSWESVDTLPYNFYGGCSVIYNDEIHLLGGNSSTVHYKYNGTLWESVSTLPYKFSGSGAIVLDNEIHILGGNSSLDGTDKKTHCKYDGISWEIVSTLPYVISGGSTVVYNDEIHIMGTNYSTTYNQSHYKYNGSTWESVSTLPYVSYGGRAIVYNNEIHIMGAYTSTYNKYHYKYNGDSWISVTTLPYEFRYGSVVIYDRVIHILGDYYQSNCKKHYSIKLGTYLNGYTKKDTQLYLPISTTPITSNLVATDDGYTVTEDGYVEILLNE